MKRMIWKDLKDYEGLYKISEYGDVKSLELKSKRLLKQGEVEIIFKERIMKQCGCRYKMVNLSKRNNKNETKNICVHKLVYETFIGDIKDNLSIDHIDNNRYNNHYSNLQLIEQHKNVNKYYNEVYYKDIIFDNCKLCSECGIIKPFDNFYLLPKDKRKYKNINKWRSKCKQCMK